MIKKPKHLCAKPAKQRKNNDSEGIYHPTNLIYLRYQNTKITKEPIKKYFHLNKASQNFLEIPEPENKDQPKPNEYPCSICGKDVVKNRLCWFSLTHLFDFNNSILPLLICDPWCFPILTGKESHKFNSFTKKETENINKNFILPRTITIHLMIIFILFNEFLNDEEN